MPKTRLESIIFTLITAWFMVYIMTLYNHVLATGVFVNQTFIDVLLSMWVEYIIIFLCAFFISSHLAQKLAFRIVNKDDRRIVIIVAIQLFTVILQVAFASILGTYHAYGLTIQFIPCYLMIYCQNFIMAIFIQVLLVGPLSRGIFRFIFRRHQEITA